MIRKFRIGFWNQAHAPIRNNNLFGCSVHGYATNHLWANPDDNGVSYWEQILDGEIFTGNYNKVLNSLSTLNFTPKVCLALFNKSTGMEEFIARFSRMIPLVPIIGGGASRADGKILGDLIPNSDDVAILAVAEGNFSLQSLNIYDKTNTSIKVKRTADREFSLLRVLPDGEWQNAIDFYRNHQNINSISESNFELMPFCDRYGRNIHCNTDGRKLIAGEGLHDSRWFW